MRQLRNSYLILSLFALFSCSENSGTISLSREPLNPQTIDTEEWMALEDGIYSGFGNTYIRYPAGKPPQNYINDSISLTGWKGERLNCQLLLWSKTSHDSVSVEAYMHSKPQGLRKDDIEIRPVRYVLTDEFLNGCGYRDKDTIPAYISADMLDHNNPLHFTGMQVRPIWISIDIPEDITPGFHSFQINIYDKTDTINQHINIDVQDHIMPSPSEWSFHLDLWQNPFAVARYHDVDLWSVEHINLLRPLLAMLAEAGQKCITTSITPKPWGGQTYDPFESMITWIRNSDGTWEYDYSVFDQYVQLAMECGIDDQINCYSMVPWGNIFGWFDEDSAKFVSLKASPGSRIYRDLWYPFLNDFRVHLMEMGWLDQTSIALDERDHREMEELFTFLKDYAPDFKVSMAGNYFEDLNSNIYDFCFNWSELDDNTAMLAKKRKNKGLLSTFYVCCSDERPNTFTFSPPAESVYLAWIASSLNLDGFLRWAYNSWPEEPVYDSRFISWPAGDTYLVYPEARSSVRFEGLIEGIQDMEKLRVLREKLSVDPSMNAAEAEHRINGFMESIGPNTLDTVPAMEIIMAGKALINEISRINQ